MFYYLTIALQGFCIYHLIKNRSQYYWIFIIIFIPVIGSIIYLVTQVYNKRDASIIKENLTSVLIPTKKVKDLEKKLQFAETFQNRLDLADAFFEMKDYKNAITHYEVALKDETQNKYFILENLIASYYGLEDYNKTITYAEALKKYPEFNKSKSEFIYGLALDKTEQSAAAEKHLKAIDQRYSNYSERLILAKFYIERDNIEAAKEILNEITIESQHMTKPNKRKYSKTINEVEKLLKSI
ncbi:TRAFs-binding domain-containing protein [Lacinutrix mariniflava]|uniref:TRAFs-binding domain-containing protein n=1 Tax=Lacinutrix mariniflava TaxID=342955 RepID=UPI0006E2F719|nr:TRAFs-binding domain-containing protein [Lacinutrix mariniflava]